MWSTPGKSGSRTRVRLFGSSGPGERDEIFASMAGSILFDCAVRGIASQAVIVLDFIW